MLAADTDSFTITDDAGESTLNKVATQAEPRGASLVALVSRLLPPYPLRALIAACRAVQG
jgi:hypothetical protein